MNIFKFLLKLLNNLVLVSFLYLNLIQQTFAIESDDINFEKYGFSEDKLNKIDRLFNKAVGNKEIPGAVVAISRYGKIIYKKAFGLQDPQKNIPMSLDF